MLKSFKCKETQKLWMKGESRKLAHDMQRVALRKLAFLNDALLLNNLRTYPGNRLEALKGNRAGQYSIRINDQWRMCFRWDEGSVYDIEIVDYH